MAALSGFFMFAFCAASFALIFMLISLGELKTEISALNRKIDKLPNQVKSEINYQIKYTDNCNFKYDLESIKKDNQRILNKFNSISSFDSSELLKEIENVIDKKCKKPKVRMTYGNPYFHF